MDLSYRALASSECELIGDINASQFIGRAWRDVAGVRQLVRIDYQDPDWPNGAAHHLNNLRKTLSDGGAAFGAFGEDGRLVGFVTVNRELFGARWRHVLLDQLFISLEHRNRGIGRMLFGLATEAARQWQADKIYICAGSAEETIAFYRAIGCVEAIEINQALQASDLRDFQFEYVLGAR